MKPYPKNIYQTAALIQKYKDAGLVITDDQKVETALNEIDFIVCADIVFISMITPLKNTYQMSRSTPFVTSTTLTWSCALYYLA